MTQLEKMQYTAGFSKTKGYRRGPGHIARAWAELMNRLGYQHYVSQGGNWGSVVSDKMGSQKPAGLLRIHVNMPATVLADVAKALNKLRNDGGHFHAYLSNTLS